MARPGLAGDTTIFRQSLQTLEPGENPANSWVQQQPPGHRSPQIPFFSLGIPAMTWISSPCPCGRLVPRTCSCGSRRCLSVSRRCAA
jgi:hypothetical protein